MCELFVVLSFTRLCLDTTRKPQVAYSTSHCLSGPPCKYWTSLSLLNFHVSIEQAYRCLTMYIFLHHFLTEQIHCCLTSVMVVGKVVIYSALFEYDIQAPSRLSYHQSQYWTDSLLLNFGFFAVLFTKLCLDVVRRPKVGYSIYCCLSGYPS